jgi:YidC/Oxa1 family membrane protein insertase
MDTQKLVLFLIFSTSLLFLWEAWQKHQLGPSTSVATQGATHEVGTPGNEDMPIPGEKLATAQPGSGPSSADDTVPIKAGGKLPRGERIAVKTDLVMAEIDTAGGDLRRLELLHHPDKEDRSKPFALLHAQQGYVYVAQSGLIGDDLPNHKTRYTADSESYALQAGQDKVEVRLAAPEADGVRVT